MKKTGYQSLRCGLLGEHLGHSFSPQIHRELADYEYRLIELAPDELAGFLTGDGYDALNVTIPYKKAVIPYLDELSDEAQRIGAVNTIVRRDGKKYGYNTDYFGFDSLITHSQIPVDGKKVLVLGTGGASLTVQAVLADRGAGEITVISRNGADNYGNLDRHTDAEVIVNATPVGMYPNNGVSPVSLRRFPRCEGVLDLIYNPARTALLLEAEELGIPAENGLYMLVAQAASACGFFTGSPVGSDAVEQITAGIALDTQNVILIGMPGCGKSTVGREIARISGRPFVDADEEFVRCYSVTPADVITGEGEEKFRQMEHTVLCELSKKSGYVISCGGGAVTREENYAPLHQNGVILFLQRELSRLSTDGRPLSKGRSAEELYRERIDAYRRFADLEITSTEVVEKTATAALDAIARRQIPERQV